MNRYPWIEMSLLIGLPLLVMVAGVITTVLSMQHGFTPLDVPAVTALR